MKERIKAFLAACILALAMPYIITLLFQGNEAGAGGGLADDAGGSAVFGAADGGEDAESYLLGVVAREIPLDYQFEAVKAQAVIARTALAAADDGAERPESMSGEEMMELWGQEGFEENYGILEEAVRETGGEILSYNGKPINAAFHAVSAGRTRDAKEPYLSGVDSKMDIPSPDYLTVTFLEKKEFADRLKSACPDAEITEEGAAGQVVVKERDAGDYVLQAEIGGKSVTGEEARGFLGLPSSCFYIKEVEGKVRIVTKGLGHGLGLSQYGANELAKEGKDYREILHYYYKNVEIGRDPE